MSKDPKQSSFPYFCYYFLDLNAGCSFFWAGYPSQSVKADMITEIKKRLKAAAYTNGVLSWKSPQGCISCSRNATFVNIRHDHSSSDMEAQGKGGELPNMTQRSHRASPGVLTKLLQRLHKGFTEDSQRTRRAITDDPQRTRRRLADDSSRIH